VSDHARAASLVREALAEQQRSLTLMREIQSTREALQWRRFIRALRPVELEAVTAAWCAENRSRESELARLRAEMEA
jgi:hypothetical protein